MLSWWSIGILISASSVILFVLFYVRYMRPLPLRYPEKQATVQCRCGKVRFGIRNYESCYRLQCCCKQCRKRVEWVQSRGYNIPKYDPPVRGVWLHNAFTFVEGEEHLKPWKLNQETPTRWLNAECCGSQMGITHPVHLGNICVFDEDLVDSSPLDYKCRIFVQDWDAATFGPYPPYKGQGPELGGGIRAIVIFRFLFSAGTFWAAVRRPVKQPGDTTFEEIVARTGPVQLVDSYEA